MFAYPGDSHRHSLKTLNSLYEYDDFMESIATVLDLGCGTGEDLEWWATRTTRDEVAIPLNIKCTGIDLAKDLPMAKKHSNITYRCQDFETISTSAAGNFDILWSHDSFQYCVSPIKTLSNWWNIASEGAMLIIIVPTTVTIERRLQQAYLTSGCYYHHTMISLMYMLATSGWDCKSGFFLQKPEEPWIHCIAYKSTVAPQDPKNTSWYSLREQNLLPDSADDSVFAHGYPRQQDLVLPWVDKSFSIYGR